MDDDNRIISGNLNNSFVDPVNQNNASYNVNMNQNFNSITSTNEVNVNNTLNSNFQNNNHDIIMPGFNNFNNETLSTINTQVSSSENISNQQFINQESDNNQNISDTNSQVLYDTTNSISNKPIEKKKKKATLQINSELKFAIILALILLVIMMFIPNIFDFFEELRLKYF